MVTLSSKYTDETAAQISVLCGTSHQMSWSLELPVDTSNHIYIIVLSSGQCLQNPKQDRPSVIKMCII